MGKWASRLTEKTAAPVHGTTDKTAKRGLLSVLAVPTKGGEREIQVQPMLGGDPASKVEALDLAAVAWTEDDISRFYARRERLLRWGWPERDAEALADRLTRRDREADPRVSCTDCKHYMPGRCGNHAAAMLLSREVGRDLAAMLQSCPGHELREEG